MPKRTQQQSHGLQGVMVADRIRVLWLIKGLGPGGAERLLAAAATARDRTDFDCEVAYLLPYKNHLVAEFQAAGMPVHCLSAQDERNPAWAGRLRRLLVDGDFDVLHAHSPYAAGVARLVVQSLPLARRPALVSTEHNIWSTFAAPTRWLNAATARFDRAHFAVSEDVRASMAPTQQAVAEVVVHGVDMGAIGTAAESRERVRDELGFGADEVVVGTVANYRAQKAYPNLMRAARQVLNACPAARFVAVGQGPLESEINQLHAELELGDRFQLLGYRPDAQAVLAASDIFTLASDYEGLPVALMEALALGRPIVATAVGGVPEAVNHGVEGLLVPPADVAALAASIIELVNNPDRRAAMGGAAAVRGEQFDITRAVRHIEQRYREVLEESSTVKVAGARGQIKRVLATPASNGPAAGLTMLIYHRVGGGTPDERDMTLPAFEEQMAALARHRVVPLDTALDELAAGDDSPKVVITFDDGFADVHSPVLNVLQGHALPFTLYLATGYVGGLMHWEGSTAKAPGPALTWDQLTEVMATGLCTIGNHTHTHARPELLSEEELDGCTAEIQSKLGVSPAHFAYTWGISVPRMQAALRARFRSAATGDLGRNHPGDDFLRLRRIPVRGSDPLPFFEAKLSGNLWPERAYNGIVSVAKRLGARA